MGTPAAAGADPVKMITGLMRRLDVENARLRGQLTRTERQLQELVRRVGVLERETEAPPYTCAEAAAAPRDSGRLVIACAAADAGLGVLPISPPLPVGARLLSARRSAGTSAQGDAGAARADASGVLEPSTPAAATHSPSTNRELARWMRLSAPATLPSVSEQSEKDGKRAHEASVSWWDS
jgi:hypothetical protein